MLAEQFGYLARVAGSAASRIASCILTKVKAGRQVQRVNEPVSKLEGPGQLAAVTTVESLRANGQRDLRAKSLYYFRELHLHLQERSAGAFVVGGKVSWLRRP